MLSVLVCALGFGEVACDMGFGEVDFRGWVEKWGKSVGGGSGCEVWGMPTLAPKPL